MQGTVCSENENHKGENERTTVAEVVVKNDFSPAWQQKGGEAVEILAAKSRTDRHTLSCQLFGWRVASLATGRSALCYPACSLSRVAVLPCCASFGKSRLRLFTTPQHSPVATRQWRHISYYQSVRSTHMGYGGDLSTWLNE